MLVMSDVLRGYTETIILSQLVNGDNYGYSINKNIQKITNNDLELKDGTLYTAFKRLEKEGLITSYWGEKDVGARRRYYSITTLGMHIYKENVEDFLRANNHMKNLLKPQIIDYRL
ncbi:MAG: PadR family transcriptional regulator [Lachnospirales bacterium]